MAPPLAGTVRLASGALLPRIGFGVYKVPPGKDTYEAVLNALRGGYRHIDTARAYQNEADVGAALAASKVPRSEVFVTTKLWTSEWGYEKAIAGVKSSLERLQTGYIDLMLLHVPGDPALRAETWRGLEACRAQGLLRDIGVSNFGQAHLERLAETATIQPAVNQLEVHPWLQRRELVAYCKEKRIVVEAYSPLAKAKRMEDPVVTAVAHRLGASPAQVLIAWSLAKGLVPLPKSTNLERQRTNLEAAEQALSETDVAELDALEEGLTTGWDPVRDDPV
jgi:diketogulonate reductase-like aldo/keto reductase